MMMSVTSWSGLSPRVRGSLKRYDLHVTESGSIPACAGEPIILMPFRSGYAVYPRVCGGALWFAKARQCG